MEPKQTHTLSRCVWEGKCHELVSFTEGGTTLTGTPLLALSRLYWAHIEDRENKLSFPVSDVIYYNVSRCTHAHHCWLLDDPNTYFFVLTKLLFYDLDCRTARPPLPSYQNPYFSRRNIVAHSTIIVSRQPSDVVNMVRGERAPTLSYVA